MTYLKINDNYQDEATIFYDIEQRRLKLLMESMKLCKFVDPNCQICKINGEYSTIIAARNGHLECLKYAHENGCPWDKFTCADAARNGHLECLKYAHENDCPMG